LKKLNLSKEFIENIFSAQYTSHSQAAKRLPHLSVPQIHLLLPLLSKEQCEYLKVEQIQQLDFSKLNLSKEFIENIFSAQYTSHSQANKRLPHLSMPQIHLILPLLSKEQCEYLSLDQVKQLDFSKLNISEELIVNIFSAQYTSHSQAAKRLPHLSMPQIHLLLPFLSKEQCEYLSPEQVRQLDFSKVNVTPKLVSNIFPTEYGTYSQAAKRIPLLSKVQLDLIKAHLSKEALSYAK